jgi:hypothetical protein
VGGLDTVIDIGADERGPQPQAAAQSPFEGQAAAQSPFEGQAAAQSPFEGLAAPKATADTVIDINAGAIVPTSSTNEMAVSATTADAVTEVECVTKSSQNRDVVAQPIAAILSPHCITFWQMHYFLADAWPLADAWLLAGVWLMARCTVIESLADA